MAKGVAEAQSSDGIAAVPFVNALQASAFHQYLLRVAGSLVRPRNEIDRGFRAFASQSAVLVAPMALFHVRIALIARKNKNR